MRRFCGAARAAPLATRAFPLRAVTGRALSTMPAKPVRLDPQLESVLARFKKGGSNEKEGAARLVEDFERLQSRKVMRVLLVCSDYDSYTFEEDGLLTELIDAEYSDNHLSKPPTIERVPTPEKAITRVRENPSGFDLIITTHGSQSVSLAFLRPCTVVFEALAASYLVPGLFGQLAEEAGAAVFFLHSAPTVRDAVPTRSHRSSRRATPTRARRARRRGIRRSVPSTATAPAAASTR